MAAGVLKGPPRLSGTNAIGWRKNEREDDIKKRMGLRTTGPETNLAVVIMRLVKMATAATSESEGTTAMEKTNVNLLIS